MLIINLDFKKENKILKLQHVIARSEAIYNILQVRKSRFIIEEL